MTARLTFEKRPFEKRLVAWLSGAGDALVSVLFPAGCRLCERVLLSASTVPICEEGLGSFPALGGAACETCGQPLAAWSLGREGGEAAGGAFEWPRCRRRQEELWSVWTDDAQ